MLNIPGISTIRRLFGGKGWEATDTTIPRTANYPVQVRVPIADEPALQELHTYLAAHSVRYARIKQHDNPDPLYLLRREADAIILRDGLRLLNSQGQPTARPDQTAG